LKTATKYYRVDLHEICYLKFIIEAYDGIAVLSTVNKESNLVMLRIAPGCESDVEELLIGLKTEMKIEAEPEYQAKGESNLEVVGKKL